MKSDSLEELRQRLLRDGSVQEMIRVRAYEIFLMRGVLPGGPAQDWFQAEGEVLAFLLAHQPPEHQTDLVVEQISTGSVEVAAFEPAPEKNRKSRSTPKKPALKKTAARRTSAKTSGKSESKPKRTRKKSKSEDETA